MRAERGRYPRDCTRLLAVLKHHKPHRGGPRPGRRRILPGGAGLPPARIENRRYAFGDLKTLLAKASPTRSGDQLAGVAAETGEEQIAAQYALADLPLATFLHEPVVPYETDEVTPLIIDTQDRKAFAPIAHLTVAGVR